MGKKSIDALVANIMAEPKPAKVEPVKPVDQVAEPVVEVASEKTENHLNNEATAEDVKVLETVVDEAAAEREVIAAKVKKNTSHLKGVEKRAMEYKTDPQYKSKGQQIWIDDALALEINKYKMELQAKGLKLPVKAIVSAIVDTYLKNRK